MLPLLVLASALVALAYVRSALADREDLAPACNSGDGRFEEVGGQWKVNADGYLYLQVKGAVADPMFARVRVPIDADFGRIEVQYSMAGGGNYERAIDVSYSENRAVGYRNMLVEMPAFEAKRAMNCNSDIRMRTLVDMSYIGVAVAGSLAELGQCSCDDDDPLAACTASSADDEACVAPCVGQTASPSSAGGAAGVCGAGSPALTSLTFPVRGIFHYNWFPQTWTVGGEHVKYHPDLGYYSSSDPKVVDRHIECMDYAKMDLGIFTWWGIDQTQEKLRVPLLLDRTKALGSNVKWAPYYEKEGFDDKDSDLETLKADLAYLKDNYADHQAWARVEGKPVIFVWNVNSPTCEVASRFAEAANGEWHVVLKTFSGSDECPHNCGSWHQYGIGASGAVASSPKKWSYTIGPGFWKANEDVARTARDVGRWWGNVRDWVASDSQWHLVVSLSEWGEGTAIEPSEEWASPSGFGDYLDALHFDGDEAAFAAGTLSPTTSAQGTSPTTTTEPDGKSTGSPSSGNDNGEGGGGNNGASSRQHEHNVGFLLSVVVTLAWSSGLISV